MANHESRETPDGPHTQFQTHTHCSKHCTPTGANSAHTWFPYVHTNSSKCTGTHGFKLCTQAIHACMHARTHMVAHPFIQTVNHYTPNVPDLAPPLFYPIGFYTQYELITHPASYLINPIQPHSRTYTIQHILIAEGRWSASVKPIERWNFCWEVILAYSAASSSSMKLLSVVFNSK